MTSIRTNMSLAAALHEAEEQYSIANPKSHDRHQKACDYLPGGNTRTTLFYTPFPLTMARGEGARLWDLDGHVYTDFLGEYTAGIYGHSNSKIQSTIEHVLQSGIAFGAPNDYEAKLAELICKRFPSCDKVRFCNSGTEGNLMALAAARAVTGRSHVLVFNGGYHGGAFNYMPGKMAMNAPFPTVIAEYNDLEGTLALIETHAEQLAAILIEPMMGTGGGISGDPVFLHSLREIATDKGIVLIFDEVMTSRLAPGGLQEKLGITPDMTTFGKYLGGGLTFGAFGGCDDIMGRFDPRHAEAFIHAGTYNNNVLTMAAGVTGLSEVFTPEAAVSLNAAGDELRGRLLDLASRHRVPVKVMGLGSILFIHFQEQEISRPADTQATDPAARALFHLHMLSKGYNIARMGFMSLSLPLMPEDYDGFVEAFEDFISLYGTVLRN